MQTKHAFLAFFLFLFMTIWVVMQNTIKMLPTDWFMIFLGFAGYWMEFTLVSTVHSFKKMNTGQHIVNGIMLSLPVFAIVTGLLMLKLNDEGLKFVQIMGVHFLLIGINMALGYIVGFGLAKSEIRRDELEDALPAS